MKSFKKDFPIFQQTINGHPLTYLDSAATSQKPQGVIDAVNHFYETYYSNIHRGLYPIAEKATSSIGKVREQIAEFIHAKKSSEIVFTHGTTEGINILAHGLRSSIQKDDAILITEMEHHSNIISWQQLAKEKNAHLFYIAISDTGELTDEIKDEHDKIVYHSVQEIPNLKIISMTHVSNVLGTVNPVKDIFNRIKTYNPQVITIVDAAQSVPHMPIDVQDLDCDFLVFSGHKMFGPSGIGVLYGKKEQLDQLEPFIYGSQMIRDVTKRSASWNEVPHKFESGTLPLEAIIGLGAAIEYIYSIGTETIQKHDKELIQYAFSQLQSIKNVQVYGPQSVEQRSSIISFTINGIHPHDIAQILGDIGICIRAGHHCSQPLHTRLGIPATARASFYLYNDREDIDRFVEGIHKVKRVFQET